MDSILCAYYSVNVKFITYHISSHKLRVLLTKGRHQIYLLCLNLRPLFDSLSFITKPSFCIQELLRGVKHGYRLVLWWTWIILLNNSVISFATLSLICRVWLIVLEILTASTSNLVSMLLILLYALCDLINLCCQHFSVLDVNMSLAVTRHWDMTSTTSHFVTFVDINLL